MDFLADLNADDMKFIAEADKRDFSVDIAFMYKVDEDLIKEAEALRILCYNTQADGELYNDLIAGKYAVSCIWDNDKIVAGIYAKKDNDSYNIKYIFVHPSYRGNNYSQKLIQSLDCFTINNKYKILKARPSEVYKKIFTKSNFRRTEDGYQRNLKKRFTI